MNTRIDTNQDGRGRKIAGRWAWRLKIGLGATALAATAAVTGAGTAQVTYSNDNDGDTPAVVDSYVENLKMIKSSFRSTEEDNSPFLDTEQANLDTSNGSPLITMDRNDYLNIVDVPTRTHDQNNFPIPEGGQFRTACEFSHFAYDDPIIHPNLPGKSHLHMFFGNTDVNAYTTEETLTDAGGGTCNGGELNRTGYWAPAMFDGDGNVRVPERIVVYYKGENWNNAGNRPTFPDGSPNPGSAVYEKGMRKVAPVPEGITDLGDLEGGASFQVNYKCSNNFSAPQFADGKDNIPNCNGDYYFNTFGSPYPATRVVLEMEIKFFYCWPAGNTEYEDYTLWGGANGNGNWFVSDCTGNALNNPPFDDQVSYPNLSYFVNYEVGQNPDGTWEDTSDWFLSADVDPATVGGTPALKPGGAGFYHHGDWWNGWRQDINQEWVDNCTNFANAPNGAGAASGCGFGWLSDGGPNAGQVDINGRALRVNNNYDGPFKVPAATLFNQLCAPLNPAHAFTTDMSAAWCKP